MSLVESDLWDNFLRAIKTKLQGESFETWFRPIRFEGIDVVQRLIRLRAPNQVVQDWVKSKYASLIDHSLVELSLAGYSIEWIIHKETAGAEPRTVSSESPGGSRHNQPAAAPQSFPSFVQGPSSAVAVARQIAIDPALNSKYTFENFVVGSCNQFAHAASLAVVDMPSKTYNPLYVYGGVGLGKTHLMHAIGQAIKQRNQNLRLTYLSSERFMNELINAIRYDKTIKFRDKYRNIDVLLMDDIQFLAGKERTQEEFFHTFNALYDAQKQIVISSDCPPREIPTLEERLHSRFEWGLIADIQPPDLETKVAILKRKADLDRINLPDNVALFIASKIKSNIRELEGSLVRLTAYASLRGLPMDLDLAHEVLRTIIAEESSGVSVELIQKTVAGHYGLKVADLKSKNNSRKVAVPRQVAMYLCKTLTKSSFPEIGREFGGKHHTTVLHSVNKIAQLYAKDSNFHKDINTLISDLK